MEERKENLRVGVCGKSKILVESAANLDYVEEDVQGFLIPEHPDEKFNPPSARKINILPIVAANRFLPAHLRSTGTSVDIIGLEHYIKNAFKRACQVGIKIIVFGSSGSREVEKGYSKSRAEQEFVNILKLMGPLANDHSVTVVVEPLNSEECNINPFFVSTGPPYVIGILSIFELSFNSSLLIILFIFVSIMG